LRDVIIKKYYMIIKQNVSDGYEKTYHI